MLYVPIILSLGENSFLSDSFEGLDIECKTLFELMEERGIKRIDGAKFDIRGI
jgi:hypothetical protein